MICAVFLAAGHSKRFGSDKLLFEYEGQTLAERAFALRPADMPGIAVVRTDAAAVLAEKAGLSVVRCPADIDDSALSIRLAAEALPESCEGAMFFVCDQPWLRPETVQRLADCFRKETDKIWVLAHGERSGNPCVFPRRFFPALMALPADKGGKYVIRRNPDCLAFCQVTDSRELDDMDTPLN